jgi:hypothetical protein
MKKNGLFTLLLGLTLASGCFAQSSAEIDQYLDQELKAELAGDDEIEQTELEDIDTIEKKFRAKSKKRVETRKKRKLYFHTKVEPYRAILKKESRLKVVGGSTYRKNLREVQVIAVENPAKPTISYIYNRNGEIKYQTPRENLISVQKDYDLSTGIDATVKYKKVTQRYTDDKGFTLKNSVNLYLEQARGELYTNLFAGDEKNVQSRRLEAKSYFLTSLPVKLGLSSSYQFGDWKGHPNDLTISWKAAYLGPTLLYSFRETEQYSIDAQLSFQRSMFYEITDEQELTIDLDASVFELQVGPQFDTSYGRFSLNFALRQYRTSITGASEFINWNPRKGKITSLSFSLGYLFELNI